MSEVWNLVFAMISESTFLNVSNETEQTHKMRPGLEPKHLEPSNWCLIKILFMAADGHLNAVLV